MKRIFIVDDHPVLRMAVRGLMEQAGHEIIGEANNGRDALARIKELKPDLVVLDITLPDIDGIQVIERIQEFDEPIDVLVLTTHDPKIFAKRCQTAGAAAYIWKQGNMTDVVNATQAIFDGYTYFPKSHTAGSHTGAVSEEESLLTLTNREVMVLQGLAHGQLVKDIAEGMLLSHKTVSTYKARVLVKLNLTTTFDLIEFAKRHNLIDVAE